METMYYLPVAGTNAADDPWVVDGGSPLTRFLRARGFEPLRKFGGVPWNWSTKLNGLWWTGKDIWREDAGSLHEFLITVPYQHRNVFAHSHGGQLPLIACGNGLKIRSLTTFGTPVRADVGAGRAWPNIGFWQHVYDADRDWMQTLKRLGQLADWNVSFKRRFDLPGVLNHAVKDVDHSRLLRDESAFHVWDDLKLLELVRQSATTHEPR